MKKLLLVSFSLSVLLSCSSDSKESNSSNSQETEEEVKTVITSDYQLISSESSAKWERTLDQKPTKQKVKLFGKMVDVELGEVKLNTNGTVQIKEGNLTTTDDKISSCDVVFDMASFKFSEEKGSGLFDVTEYPNSTLELYNFEQSIIKGKLTIQEVSNEIDVNLTSSLNKDIYTLTGSFVLNTLDYPLRKKVKEKDINKDEIKVTFEFIYQLK